MFSRLRDDWLGSRARCLQELQQKQGHTEVKGTERGQRSTEELEPSCRTPR